MLKCSIYKKSPSYCYKHFKCRCKICRGWKRRTDTYPNRVKAREVSRIWRLNNLERSRLNSINYQKNNPDKLLSWKLKHFKLTIEDYNNLLKQQNGVCAICGQSEIKKIKNTPCRLSIDHDHQTGKVRGLLCSKCNTGVGLFDNNCVLLNKAIEYLNNNGEIK